MARVCEICGNERDAAAARCPFCGAAESSGLPVARVFLQKTVNLEEGRPVVELALRRLTEIIEDGRRNGITILTIIHGYGSSGKGGAIREECRKILDHMKNGGTIKDFIAGELFNKRNNQVRALLQRYPRLRSDVNLNRNNRGVTLVILSVGVMSLILPFIAFHATLWS